MLQPRYATTPSRPDSQHNDTETHSQYNRATPVPAAAYRSDGLAILPITGWWRPEAGRRLATPSSNSKRSKRGMREFEPVIASTSLDSATNGWSFIGETGAVAGCAIAYHYECGSFWSFGTGYP